MPRRCCFSLVIPWLLLFLPDQTQSFSGRLYDALSRSDLSIADIPGKGRGLVAQRRFPQGSQVLLEDPFAYALSSRFGSHENFCHHSLASQSRVRLKRCAGCRFARYASAEDQKKAWSKHRLECRRIKECIDHGYMPSSFLLTVARMFDAKKHRFNSSTATWEDILELDTNYDTWSTDLLASFAQITYVVRDFMADGDVNNMFCPKEWNLEAARLLDQTFNATNGIENPREILMTICRLYNYGFTICDEEERPIGTGLYPLASLCNHDCAPNCLVTFCGPSLQLRATEEIEMGQVQMARVDWRLRSGLQEITISYVDSAEPHWLRRKTLHKRYLINCSCSLCSNETASLSRDCLPRDALLDEVKSALRPLSDEVWEREFEIEENANVEDNFPLSNLAIDGTDLQEREITKEVERPGEEQLQVLSQDVDSSFANIRREPANVERLGILQTRAEEAYTQLYGMFDPEDKELEQWMREHVPQYSEIAKEVEEMSATPRLLDVSSLNSSRTELEEVRACCVCGGVVGALELEREVQELVIQVGAIRKHMWQDENELIDLNKERSLQGKLHAAKTQPSADRANELLQMFILAVQKAESILHDNNLSLLRLREAMQSQAVEAKSWKFALSTSYKVLRRLYKIYPRCSPYVGLQEAFLGKLCMFLSGEPDKTLCHGFGDPLQEAVKHLREAKLILSGTHGSEHVLVQDINRLLQEAHYANQGFARLQ
ncbi:hypothetical protein GUITHDRAFT_136248 [Guillardia theta CCMP2712]|uniref:SET domain-containing protein n=1 Tax=Guillardia theta (strain CCMP2712) TaxID=905079 RepID=L1JKN5_GUITC|nr:hypothetical protein GUITHDRAFT_136248 [Guillardia theta CCMP2712]EKX49066.1 hypothetical protein GUITHDRAFT_136248 [Guillardia theta CCMP2712]|eukprot:XP_005836046.1 hypothetical protein GUITHDRAFT_136248 [Guillardia theta CCMP2712]